MLYKMKNYLKLNRSLPLLSVIVIFALTQLEESFDKDLNYLEE